jgi:hypothetical protein
MSIDPVTALKGLKRADKFLRKSVEEEVRAARHLAYFAEKFGESDFRARLGDAHVDELLAIHRRVNELGEEQYKLVRFRERKAEFGVAPEQN